MNQNRRTFLKTLTLGIIGAGLPAYLLLNNSRKYKKGIEIENGIKIFPASSQNSLESLAHTIIPSTKNIDIKNIFINYIAESKKKVKFYNLGINQLNNISNKYYKKSFTKLKNLDDKKEVVVKLEKLNPTFFRNCRKMTIYFYYSHPYSWKKLGYNGPPQPKGFMDYHLPPKI